jgi:hypothetical protein
MLKTFEFIETPNWCRLANSNSDLFENRGTYTPLFKDLDISLNPREFVQEDSKHHTQIFFGTPSNGGFKLNDLLEGVKVSGSVLAHLGRVVIKDESLLVLVSDHLSLVEGYGNRRWANYQINTWPMMHNNPLCLVGVDKSKPPQKMRVKAYSIDSKVQHIPIAGIYLSVRSQDSNIYHWLIETLVRLKCLDNIPELKKLPLIVRDPLNNFQLETLRMMGVDNKLIVTNGESFVIDELFFPSIPSPPSLHPEAMRWLRDKFLNHLPQLPPAARRRLYISRSDSNRQVENEDAIFEYLQKIGFEKLIMSQLSVTQQIDIFRTAEIVVLPHGAAGTHLLFAPQDCEVIELHSPKWVNNCYLSLCKSLNLSYKWLIGTESSADLNYIVSLDKLKAYFE